MSEFVVLDASQVGELGPYRVTMDVWRAVGILTERGVWPVGGARADFQSDTRRVVLHGPRADSRLRDDLESVLLGLL